MIATLGRRWAVAITAWALRRGVTLDQAADAIGRAFSWRDQAWRGQLLEDARNRNRQRLIDA